MQTLYIVICIYISVEIVNHCQATKEKYCIKNLLFQIYELDGIPLILDNCSIDDNNPCILLIAL